MNSSAQTDILVINANSSCSVTEGLREELVAPTKMFNLSIDYTEIAAAPAAIESTEDVHLAHTLTTDFVKAHTARSYVIACFCDPGVNELRSLGYQNVFGIAESAMHMAANMGGKFGMLSISNISIARHADQVKQAGLTEMLAADLPLDMGVLELEAMSARPKIEEMSRRLVNEHGAKSIILGCAGMGAHRKWLQDLMGVNVIDPCWAGVAAAAAALGTI